MLAFLPAVLSVAFAAGQVTVVNQGQKVDLGIDPLPAGSTYQWEIYCDMTVDFAQTPGNCPGGTYQFENGINNQPAVQVVFNTPGQYMVKIEVWDAELCTNNMKFIRIDVEESEPTAELSLDPNEICISEPARLKVTLTGKPPWKFKLQAEDEDGISTQEFTINENDPNPVEIDVSPEKTTIYTVVEVTDENGIQTDPSNIVTLTVHPLPVNSRIYLKP